MTVSAFSEANTTPLDDVSVSRRLADNYARNGMDPSQAYDDAQALQEFGTLL
jgi:hypothetical protein